jgi:hypothetical protein
MRKIQSKTVKCKNCQKEYNVYPYEIKSGCDKYCSRKCYDIHRASKIPTKINKNIEYTSNNPCKHCNNYFTVNRTSKINNLFCSNKCRTDYKLSHPKIKSCLYCKKEYTKHFCSKKYCSKECYHSHRRIRDLNKICLHCNTEFKTKWNTQKFCCNECYLEYIKINPFKKKTGINKICKVCKKIFYAQNWHKNKLYCSKYCSDKSRRGKGNPKNSERRSYLISIGKIQLYNSNNKGYYTSLITGKKEHYDSSYELTRMKQLDTISSNWTKKHGIRIPYKDKIGKIHHYIPDFLVNNKIIEEVKPKSMLNINNNDLKISSAKNFCKQNGYEFRVITEKELGINNI